MAPEMVSRHPDLPRRARQLLICLLVALPLAAVGPPVQAKVFVNPNGPAAKQYSAYLDRARQQGSGRSGSAGVPGSAAVAPLFGAGVKPADAKGGGTSGGSGGTAGGSNAGARPASSPALGPSGGNDSLLVALLSLAVLIPGAAFLVLRRRRSRSAH